MEHGAGPLAMMESEQQGNINSDDLHIYLGHTNDANARETAKRWGSRWRVPGDTATVVAR